MALAFRTIVRFDPPLREEVEPMLRNGDVIRGQVDILPPFRGHAVEHNDIVVYILQKVTVPGVEQTFVLSPDRELHRGPGVLNDVATYRFVFEDVDMQYGTFHGGNVNLRYFLRLTMNGVQKDHEFLVQNCIPVPENFCPLKLHVGFEDSSYIEAVFYKNNYQLNEVVNGTFNFEFWRYNTGIERVHIEIIRKVYVKGNGRFDKVVSEESHVAFELKMEELEFTTGQLGTSPFHFLLSEFDLTPTHSKVADLFRVIYYLKLVVAKEEVEEVEEVEPPEEVEELCELYELDELEELDKLDDQYELYDTSDSVDTFDSSDMDETGSGLSGPPISVATAVVLLYRSKA